MSRDAKEPITKQQPLSTLSNILLFNSRGNKTVKEEIMDSEYQVDRLTGQTWRNPVEILLLPYPFNEQDIKNHFKMFSLSIHPDRCKSPKAGEAFNVIHSAYTTLLDSSKRQIFERILEEAYQRTVYERKLENEKRKNKELDKLPEETFQTDFQLNSRRVFEEIEDKKNQLKKMDHHTTSKRIQDLELMGLKEQYRVLTDEEWDKTREQRIKKWKSFKQKDNRIGSRNTDGSIRNQKSNFTKDQYF